MRAKALIAIVMVAFCFVMTLNCFAAVGHGDDTPKKVGILLVAFGSSEASAQVSFENIDRKVKSVHAGIPVHWAYTSHIIRKKLAAEGKHLDSPEVALAKMQDEGFTHVAVQSLHTKGGIQCIPVLKGTAEYDCFVDIWVSHLAKPLSRF